MSRKRRLNELHNSILSKSAIRSKLRFKKMPKNRMRLNSRNAQRTSQSLMSRRPMKKQRKLLKKSSHQLFRNLSRILMHKEKSTRESNWKVARTTAMTKQAMKMSGSNSPLAEKKNLAHKASRLNKFIEDNRLFESR